MVSHKKVGVFRGGRLRALLFQPIIGFGLALIAFIWIGAGSAIRYNSEQSQRNFAIDAANLSLVFEQNVIRTATELDRIIKFLRRTYERSGYSASWPSLVSDEYTINDESVQIAIIDKAGMMLTSTSMLFPPKPVDLGDREHFRVHAERRTDDLFISKPVIGRASGKWSVQFTRPFWNANKEFAGVIVVSLDPNHLTRAYSDLAFGQQHGIALVGLDKIVRAGAGLYSSALGSEFSSPYAKEKLLVNGAEITQHEMGALKKLIASRTLADYPLQIIVSAVNPAPTSVKQLLGNSYFLGASAFSLLAFLAMMTSAINHHRFEVRALRLARRDPLSGVGNRLYLSELLEQSFNAPVNVAAAFLLVDLDGFKDVNDTYGHPVGDSLLVLVAQRLADLLQAGQSLARLGGDEFAILLQNDTDPIALAGEITRSLAQPFATAGLSITIGASVGIARRDDCEVQSDFMKCADLALYAAKKVGSGAYCVYHKSMEEDLRQRIMMIDGLRRAVQEKRFELHYQPIVNANTLKTVCYEALLRWNDDISGYIPPNIFIPLAEETGLILPIGAWVLEQACSDTAKHSDDTSVAVNCSAIQLKDGKFIEIVQRVLKESGLPANRLKLEITESVLIGKNSSAIEQLRQLASMGVSISIDDFGTGYSSLSYLESYPVKYLKIDRSFIVGMEKKRGLSIVQTIITLARGLDITTIAEGVETDAQLEVLKALGCNEIQGYLFSRPGPADVIFGKDFTVGQATSPRLASYPTLAAIRRS